MKYPDPKTMKVVDHGTSHLYTMKGPKPVYYTITLPNGTVWRFPNEVQFFNTNS